MPPTPPAPKRTHAWKPPYSRYVRLYHGCTTTDAANIRANGINLSLCRADTDFGRGFYTTTVRYQAEQWAIDRGRDRQMRTGAPHPPVILVFVVDRYRLAPLQTIHFVLGGHGRRAFWRLVQHCRQSTAAAIRDHHGPVSVPAPLGGNWYDMACGPVAAFWRQRYAMQDADQFIFHTPAGVQELQRLVGRRRWFDERQVT